MSEKIVGIYLAAGFSKRMGYPKLKLQVENQSLGMVALNTAVEIDELSQLFIVVRRNEDIGWFMKEIPSSNRHKISFVLSDSSEKGQSFSIKAGILAAQKERADAVVIILADQPLITAHMIQTLVHAYQQSKQKQVIHFIHSSYDGVIQPPLLCSNKTYAELLTLKGDQGAKKIIRQTDSEKKITITCSYFDGCKDIDTREDYEWLLKRSVE